MKQIVISSEAAAKIKAQFPWVYDNEILRYPKNTNVGEIIYVHSPTGEFLGVGYVNQQSKITIRVLSFDDEKIDKNFFLKRLQQAERLRKTVKLRTNAYRVVHAEADMLPGLIVDSYDGHLVVQINTAGMECQREILTSVLDEYLQPCGIYEKSDRYSREKEGLITEDGVLCGTIPSKILISEDGILFQVHLRDSQKTGFYLDQRRNRTSVANYVEPGYHVLDVFANTGGFGIHAGLKGAEEVRMIDLSQTALNEAVENTRINSLGGVAAIKADAFDYLAAAAARGERYDLIILDPPSFAKTKQSTRGAIRGFKHLVSKGLEMLNENAYIAVFSCSHHIAMDDLIEVVRETSVNAGIRLRVMEHLFQDHDHPYRLSVPQSLYLKGLVAQIG